MSENLEDNIDNVTIINNTSIKKLDILKTVGAVSVFGTLAYLLVGQNQLSKAVENNTDTIEAILNRTDTPSEEE